MTRLMERLDYVFAGTGLTAAAILLGKGQGLAAWWAFMAAAYALRSAILEEKTKCSKN